MGSSLGTKKAIKKFQLPLYQLIIAGRMSWLSTKYNLLLYNIKIREIKALVIFWVFWNVDL